MPDGIRETIKALGLPLSPDRERMLRELIKQLEEHKDDGVRVRAILVQAARLWQGQEAPKIVAAIKSLSIYHEIPRIKVPALVDAALGKCPRSTFVEAVSPGGLRATGKPAVKSSFAGGSGSCQSKTM